MDTAAIGGRRDIPKAAVGIIAIGGTAQRRHYGAGRFSFNVAQGRCPTCEGEDSMMVELLFLPSVYAPCATCNGTRYNPQAPEVEWNGRNIAQVLTMTVDEGCAFFANEPQVL